MEFYTVWRTANDVHAEDETSIFLAARDIEQHCMSANWKKTFVSCEQADQAQANEWIRPVE